MVNVGGLQRNARRVAAVAVGAVALGALLAGSSASWTREAMADGDAGVRYESAMRDGEAWAAVVEIGNGVHGTPTSYNHEGVYNPHRNHRSNEECETCHGASDGANVLTCTKCHEIELPDGWLGYYDVASEQ